jgi:hypothetical protein
LNRLVRRLFSFKSGLGVALRRHAWPEITYRNPGTVFYFRPRVPDDLLSVIGKPHLVKSLNLSERRAAIIQARAYAGLTVNVAHRVNSHLAFAAAAYSQARQTTSFGWCR